LNIDYTHRNKFIFQFGSIFGSIVLHHIRLNKISVQELLNKLIERGHKYTYKGLYSSLIGRNFAANNIKYWQKIYEVLNIEIDAQTFAQTLQDSQQFNANFKALKQAKKDAKKTN
jgi:hypothetical protein